jgi:hypothetical protein
MARVGRTLLSVAFDLALDFASDFAPDFDLKGAAPPRSTSTTVEQRRFSAALAHSLLSTPCHSELVLKAR